MLGIKMFTLWPPFGIVLAASMTCSASISSRSHTLAISFASATLRSIQRLSASLTISAVRGSSTMTDSTPRRVAPQCGAGARAALVDSTDDDGDRRQLTDGLAFGDPLRAERQPEVDPGPQSRGLFKDRQNQLFGGVGRHRALEDDEVAGAQVLPDGPRRCLDVIDDGLIVRTERRADGHDDEVIIGEGAEIGRGAKPADSYVVGDELAEPRLRHSGLAQVDLVDDALSHVDARHRPAAISQHGTDHRADVAEAHDCDARPHAADQQIDLSVAPSERASSHRGTKPFSPSCAFGEMKRGPSRLTR